MTLRSGSPLEGAAAGSAIIIPGAAGGLVSSVNKDRLLRRVPEMEVDGVGLAAPEELPGSSMEALGDVLFSPLIGMLDDVVARRKKPETSAELLLFFLLPRVVVVDVFGRSMKTKLSRSGRRSAVRGSTERRNSLRPLFGQASGVTLWL